MDRWWIASALALAFAFIPVVACTTAGSVVGRSDRWAGADMLVGFGLLTGTISILAVTTRFPLSWLMAAGASLSVIAVITRMRFPGSRSTWIALALVLPILVSAAGSKPAMWDDFWNWLPSAAYAYEHDSLPWPDLDPPFSIFPGYPQGMPLMIAAASFLGGSLVETAGPVTNVALLAGSSAVFAEALAAALVRRSALEAGKFPASLIASAVAITILLNPGLNGAVLLSSYADCASMVAVGALGLLGVEILVRLSKEPDNASGFAWRFGLIAAMLINLKQANPILLALIIAALALVVMREPAIPWRSTLPQLSRMLGPPIVLFGMWRWYLLQNSPSWEQTFRPIHDWNFGVLPQTLHSISDLIADAPVFHGLMWSVTAVGLVSLFFTKCNEARYLAAICAVVWIGYNAFLLAVYAGAMKLSDAEIAADYWRYTPHVALLGLYPPVMALATSRWPAWMKRIQPAGSMPTLAALLVAVSAMPVRSDLNNPSGREWQHFLRKVTTEVRKVIPLGSKVLIVPAWNASPFAVAVRYNLWQLGMLKPPISATILWDEGDFHKVKAWAQTGKVDYLIIQDAEGPMDEEIAALGLPHLNHEFALFAWRDGKWEKLDSWPIFDVSFH
ncbi:MAG TPA: hypothetical protein VH678_17020 [Xanthobacteraceae bacterium]|jgi:hypothetical protein